MKKFPLAVGLALAGLSIVAGPALAQNPPPAQAPAAAQAPAPAPVAPLSAEADKSDIANGYNVKVEVKVNEKGEIDSYGRVETDDPSSGEVLTKMAIVMAAKVKMPVREKNGHPIRYTAILPFHFPIEGDEGLASQNQAVPVGRGDSYVKPLYPPDLAEQDVVGGVIFEMVIDTQGNITRLTTLSASHPQFEAAARKAVEHWKYHPALKDGKAVETRWRISVAFETADKMADMKWRVPPRPTLGASFCYFDNSPARATPAAAPAGTLTPAAPAAQAPTVSVPTPAAPAEPGK